VMARIGAWIVATSQQGRSALRRVHAEPARSLVERERRFLIHSAPHDLIPTSTVTLRQGYLAADEGCSVRVRDAGPEGCTLTVKAGRGAERTELEWSIERREFNAAWAHTVGQRVEKTRQRIPFNGHVIELDVFAGDLLGLMMAEVEFTSSDALAAFEPPAWFGRDVTNDGRYTNASLALHGLPTYAQPADGGDPLPPRA
jgi:adenylate cyclase